MSFNNISVELLKIDYPKVELPEYLPAIPEEAYQKRMKALLEKMSEEDLTHVIVYGDREHFANLKFLTGYDPRFEEAILIVQNNAKPILLVGNEGFDYSKIVKIDLEVVLYQNFSLQGQPRSSSQTLAEIFKYAGINSESQIAVVGNKYMESNEFGDTDFISDLPVYIVDLLRNITTKEKIRNVTAWFTHPVKGFRIPLTVDEIARYENSNILVYNGIKNALEGLKIGISEVELAAKLGFTGEVPLSCHVSVGFGENATLGLASPSRKRLNFGEFITFGFGIWGANIARTGIALSGPGDLPTEIGDALNKVYIPYFKALLAWYKSLSVGVTAGTVYDSVSNIVEDDFYGVALNPGHQSRDEEWINSPFHFASKMKLVSGTFLQCDIIVSATAPYSGIHTEDGLVLADNELRQKLAAKYPEVWNRILARREMMAKLGYELHQDVLPLSEIQGCVAPFLLNSNLVLAKK